MTVFTSEFLGTATLVLMGGACAANAALRRAAGEGGPWLAVSAGWALALFAATWVAAPSGAHLNPAVTLALAATGEMERGQVPAYLGAQLAGALGGAALVVCAFLPHWRATHDADRVRAALVPGAEARAPLAAAVASALATFAFVMAVRAVVAHPWTAPPELGAGVDAAVFGDPDAWREGWWRFASAVALAMGGVLLGVGGASGAVVNPAYAVAGRAAHALLPVGRTGDVAWGAAAWSTVGACAGAALAAAVAKAVWG